MASDSLPKTFVQILRPEGPVFSTDYDLIEPIGEVLQRGKGRDFFVCETSDMSLRPKGHPCPRPIYGMRYLVEILSEQGDLVLDPFMGSGTTRRRLRGLGPFIYRH